VKDGIPVTSVPRTLLDLAVVTVPRQLERALEEAERLALFDLHAVERLFDRSRGKRGVRALRAVLRDYRGSPPITRSELERRFYDLCRDAGLPLPAANVLAAGIDVDMTWYEQRLVVELDSHEFHRTRAAFERDQARDAQLRLAGYRVLRITHYQLQSVPMEVIRTVKSLLSVPT
jgi:hypothetical protein